MVRKPFTLASLLLVCSLFLSAVGFLPAQAQTKPDLQIIWFAWPPCDNLQKLVSTYPDANVTVKCVPIGQWHDTIFTDFVAKGGADLPILDSQYIGEAVDVGGIAFMHDWMKDNIGAAQNGSGALSGFLECPPTSKRYYARPAMTDGVI